MKYSPTFADGLSGSVGGLVASRNRYGVYFRTKAIPVNPNTVRQQAYRAAFASAVQLWTATLTAAQRTAWASYAANTPLIDGLGAATYLTGQAMYIRTNATRLGGGLAAVNAAPTMFNLGEPVTGIRITSTAAPGDIGVDDSGGAMDTTFEIAGTTSDDGDLLVYLSEPINSSRNFSKGPYQRADAALAIASGVAVLNWTTDPTALLMATALAELQYRSIKARIAYDDGRLTQEFRALADVVFTGV